VDMLIAAFMGLVYVAPPGPVNIETARRVARSGAWAGCALQLGSLLGDALYAILGMLAWISSLHIWRWRTSSWGSAG
jgi:chemosensory pili system protein ChpE